MKKIASLSLFAVLLVGMGTGTLASAQCPSGCLFYGGDFDPNNRNANGLVYFGGLLDEYLYALDASTGAALWRYQVGALVTSSPTVVNGVMYVGATDNNVYAFHLPGH